MFTTKRIKALEKTVQELSEWTKRLYTAKTIPKLDYKLKTNPSALPAEFVLLPSLMNGETPVASVPMLVSKIEYEVAKSLIMSQTVT